MCNSIKKTIDFIERGANGVEVDVTFEPDDIYLHHGYPCDCFRYCWDRELLSNYLRFVRQATTPGNPRYYPQWTILYFDIKLKSFSEEEKRENGIRFANHLASFFFDKTPIKSTIRFIIAISYASDEDFLFGFIDKFKELGLYDSYKNFLGFDIGIEKDVNRVRTIWNRLDITNVWQGEGITNCLNPIVPNHLEKLVQIRDGRMSYFSKVYRWTIDLTDSLRSVMQHQIDGVMTNHPERVINILTKDPEFSRIYRLATTKDDPFQRIRANRRTRIHNNVNGKFKRAIQEISDSFVYFIREIFKSIF